MFGKAQLHIPMFRKAQTREFQCLEQPKFAIPMFGNAKIKNSNVWKLSQNSEFQRMEKAG